jgi:hypothetical protein
MGMIAVLVIYAARQYSQRRDVSHSSHRRPILRWNNPPAPAVFGYST